MIRNYTDVNVDMLIILYIGSYITLFYASIYLHFYAGKLLIAAGLNETNYSGN